ncbi:MAG: TolC family protein [Cyclobacteriaceae bacterium]|nr:TolC family protein [Cyclobacteriaceae bacterium]
MKFRIIALLLIFSFHQSFSQEIMKLTLKSSIELALSNNTDLRIEKNNLFISNTNSTRAIYNFLPSANGYARAFTENGNTFNQQEGVVVNGVVDRIFAGVNAELTLFRGMQNHYFLKSSTNFVNSQEMTIKQTEQLVISNVISQYLEVLFNSQLVIIEKENLILQTINLEKISSEVTLGTRPMIDLYNQKSLVKNAELNALSAEINLRNSKAQLALTLQIDPIQEIQVSEPIWILPESFDNISDIDELVSIAMENRPDLKSSQYREEGNKYSLKVDNTFLTPHLYAFGGFQSAYITDRITTQRNFNEQFFTDNTTLQYGLHLDIPIFAKYRTKSQSIQSKVRYENSVLQRENLEISVKSEVLNAYQNYINAQNSFQLATAQLDAQEESFQLNKESHELGLINIIEFSQANRDYVRAKVDFMRAKYGLVFNTILLKNSLGTLNTEDIPE